MTALNVLLLSVVLTLTVLWVSTLVALDRCQADLDSQRELGRRLVLALQATGRARGGDVGRPDARPRALTHHQAKTLLAISGGDLSGVAAFLAATEEAAEGGIDPER